MARIVDDIIHYFKRMDIDLLAASNPDQLMAAHWGRIIRDPAITNREYPVSVACLLAQDLVNAERSIEELREQLVQAWKDKHDLKTMLATAPYRNGGDS